MKLSTKIFLLLVPLFFIVIVVIAYFNYANQEKQMLEQVRNGATAQALTIRESLVNMMVTNESIDDGYLNRLRKVSDFSEIHILFKFDSLRLNSEYYSPERTQRLRAREKHVAMLYSLHYEEAFNNGTPVWTLNCLLHHHSDKILDNTSSNTPLWLSSCEQLVGTFPFTAEKKCLRCHNVESGTILGVAHMQISLDKTSFALKANAINSIGIFFVFSIVTTGFGIFVFRHWVSKPLTSLVQATEIVGRGDVQYGYNGELSSVEFKTLSNAFIKMQNNLWKAQQELIRNERLSTIGQMASNIIHDFRSPMGSIVLAAGALKMHSNITEQRRENLFKTISLSVERMNRMMRELLDYSHGEFSLNLEKKNIDEIIDAVHAEVEEHLQKKNIAFTTHKEYEGTITVDAERIHRVLINIINNAEDAMPSRGEIIITVKKVDVDIVFHIRDNGPGIPEEIRTTLFEPFVTFGKTKGTGLGLAITKKIVELHRGTITFESVIGQGTSFIITLPVVF